MKKHVMSGNKAVLSIEHIENDIHFHILKSKLTDREMYRIRLVLNRYGIRLYVDCRRQDMLSIPFRKRKDRIQNRLIELTDRFKMSSTFSKEKTL